MENIDKYRFGYVYPGHVLVIAFCIMDKYASLQEAKSYPVKNGKRSDFYAALGDIDIPGAGGCVYAALDALAMDDVEKAIAWAEEHWKGECENGYKDRYSKGAEQAKELEPAFREMWTTKWRKT